MTKGFICLWRKTFDDPIWYNSTSEQKALFITLLSIANWREKKYDIYGEELILQPGQLIISYVELAKLTGKGVSVRNVRTGIDRFEKLNFLTRQVTRRGTLITIVNWRKYQDINYGTDTPTDIELTRDRHATDTPLTQDRHAHKRTIKPCNQVTIKPSNQNTTPLPPLGERREGNKTSSVDEWEELITSFAGKNESLSGSLRTWVNMRKEMSKKRKEVFTTQALKMGLKKLHNLSNGDETVALNIVNQSVELSWKSFYPINDSRRGKQEKTVEESLARSMKVLSEGMGDIPF